MLSGNGTIDYDLEAHTLDTHKTSAAHQVSTTGGFEKQAAFDQNKNKYHIGISLYSQLCGNEIELFYSAALHNLRH